MIYRGFNVRIDNSFYRDGQHAASISRSGCKHWFDTFTMAIKFIRAL